MTTPRNKNVKKGKPELKKYVKSEVVKPFCELYTKILMTLFNVQGEIHKTS